MARNRSIAGALAALGTATALATTAVAASSPTVTSVTSKQSGNKVTITAKTKGFSIDAKNVGKTPMAGKGHQHFAMDRGKYDYPKYSGANGKLAVQLGVQGKYSPTVSGQVTYTGLPKGTHKVTVYLVRNNHSNYPNSGAKKSLTFTVK